MKWRWVMVVAFALAASWARPAFAWGMRCNGQLVGEGASQYSVLAKCGPPAYRDTDVQYMLLGGVRLQRETIWYYDFGQHRFIHVLHFHDGMLTHIELAGYGFDHGPADHCSPYQINVGMTDYELLQTCGEPQFKRDRTRVLMPDHDDASEGTYVVVRVTQWTYDFGSNQFPRTVTIRKGVVSRVKTGDGL